MSGQLLPAPEFSEPLPESPEQGVRMWLDLMECAEQLLLAGLAREADSEEDLKARYRTWYAQVIFRMMRRF